MNAVRQAAAFPRLLRALIEAHYQVRLPDSHASGGTVVSQTADLWSLAFHLWVSALPTPSPGLVSDFRPGLYKQMTACLPVPLPTGRPAFPASSPILQGPGLCESWSLSVSRYQPSEKGL